MLRFLAAVALGVAPLVDTTTLTCPDYGAIRDESVDANKFEISEFAGRW